MASNGDAREVPLLGGTANRGQVVRLDDTVRRPARPTSAATRALLEHLSGVGFDGAPRYLGVDRYGREVLSYIPGDAVTPPYPPWATTEAALASVAELLRRYHDAVEDFDAAGHAWPRPVPEPYRGELVSHNDPNLDNVVFRSGRAVALIDFDLAAPGSRLWDVAGAARLWAPLRAAADVVEAWRGAELRRLRRFVDAYGLADDERTRLPAAVLAHHDWSYRIVEDGAAAGSGGYPDYWQGGARDRSARARRWLEAQREVLLAVLS